MKKIFYDYKLKNWIYKGLSDRYQGLILHGLGFGGKPWAILDHLMIE